MGQQNIDKQYKHLKEKMNARNSLLTAVALAILSGCGGGGDGGTSSVAPPSAPAPPVTIPTPTPTPPADMVMNPLTGAAAPGSPTKTLSGIAYVGASVTAYSVNADGTSGTAIAGPVVATSSGFTLNFTNTPTSWVRLVATGGTQERAADSSIQSGGTMQLVTPFVTTAQGSFKISPLTDIAASVMLSNVKKGMTLADGFSSGMRSLLQLDGANVFMLNDVSVYLNVLKGAIKSDTKYYDAQSPNATELFMGLDNLGVLLDMPTKDVTRVVGASAQSNHLSTGVDGAGALINAGAWVGAAFDPAAAQLLKDLMAVKVPTGQKVTGASTGQKVAPRLGEYMSRYLIMDFIVDASCRGGATAFVLSRYPYYVLDAQGKMPAADCSATAARIAELRARVTTNKSTGSK